MPQDQSENYRLAATQYKLIADFVESYIEKNGRSPSNQEIADAIGRRVSTVSYHLTGMRKKGLVTWKTGSPRTIRVTKS